MVAKKAAPAAETVRVRLLSNVLRGGEMLAIGAEIDVPARRAQIWTEGGVCEPVRA